MILTSKSVKCQRCNTFYCCTCWIYCCIKVRSINVVILIRFDDACILRALGPATVTSEKAVTRPLAFTVKTGTFVAEPYVSDVSPEIVVSSFVIEPAPMMRQM